PVVALSFELIIRRAITCLVIAELLTGGLSARAAALLKGFVLQNQPGGPPVSGIRVVADGANPTITDSTGQFTLKFPTRFPGEPVRVLVVRSGWSVVNDVQLERELPSDPDRRPFEILISKESERQQWAVAFYRLRFRESSDVEYQRRQATVSTAQERDRLRRERDQALARADELARQLAEARPAEVGTDVRRAQRLFLDGQFDQALQLLSMARLQKKAKEANRELSEAVQGYLLRAKLLAARFQFDEADAAYAEAVRLAPSDGEAQFAYAYFNQSLNRFGPAGQSYEHALALYRELERTNPETYRPHVALTLSNLGILRGAQNRYAEARAAFEEALEIRRELAKTNPELYRPDVAGTLNNLGILHRDQNRYAEARACYEEALGIYRELANTKPETYRPYLAATLDNLGVLHRNQDRYAEARMCDEEALGIYRGLVKISPETYRPYLAATLNNLGVLHHGQHHYAEAGAGYNEALGIYRELAQTNPDTYRPNVALTLGNLGILHGDQNRYAEARADFEEALEIRRELAQTNPET